MHKILVVDDDDALLQIIATILRGPYVVDTAKGGPAGLLALSQTRYDLVLLDLNMPDIDGAAVVRTMRATGDQTPVVIVSGERDAAARAQQLGAVAAVGKPFDADVLESLVSHLLDERAAAAVA